MVVVNGPAIAGGRHLIGSLMLVWVYSDLGASPPQVVQSKPAGGYVTPKNECTRLFARIGGVK